MMPDRGTPTYPLLAAVLGLMTASGCQTAPAGPRPAGDPVEGKRVSEQLCASCHAVSPGGKSPNPDAPPFPGLPDRYGARSLADDLENAVSISHLKMPTFYLGEGHGDDIAAYLASLKAGAAPPP